MKYDWKKIIEDQANSWLPISKYCTENKIMIRPFYKNRKKLVNESEISNDSFIPIEVVKEKKGYRCYQSIQQYAKQ